MLFPSRKRRVWLAVFVVTTGFLASFWHYGWPSNNYIGWTGGDLRGPGPDFRRFREAERGLPQHNLDLPLPEGREGRYVKFSTQVAALGWNNVLLELLLCSHLAWRSKRAYVFQDYVWSPTYYPWRVREYARPRNPITTLVSGPTAGGAWEEGDDSPRAVSAEWFDVVCPKGERELIDSYWGKEPVQYSDGKTMMDNWVNILTNSEARCIEIVPNSKGQDNFPQVFDLWLIGDRKLLTVWEEFRASPVSRLFKASPLALSAVALNEHLFFPSERTIDASYNPYEHMMVIHIRRGDYLAQCSHLAHYNSSFFAWNLLPELPDAFEHPKVDYEIGHPPPEVHTAYIERCLPNNQYILEKVQSSKEAWEKNPAALVGGGDRRLDVLYVMTNEKDGWVEELKESLRMSDGGWKKIITTRDLQLGFEQTGANMVVDMEFARRAAVYIGNGWSSMTANILHQRLVDGKEPLSNRFW